MKKTIASPAVSLSFFFLLALFLSNFVFCQTEAKPLETKKGGVSHELSSNGVWSLSDPKKATRELGEKSVKRMVDKAVKFIETWKKAKR